MMMGPIDVVIVGDGPSALMLSYILHGNIPYYNPELFGSHPDPLLHDLLLPYTVQKSDDAAGLLSAVSDEKIMEYIRYSCDSFFSNSVLPFNLLMDALAASDESQFASYEERQCRILWLKKPEFKVNHLVLGHHDRPGGQWESSRLDDQQQPSLSYSEMLSLPGYAFSQFYHDQFGSVPPDFFRPPRHQVAKYYAEYPSAVGIDKSIKSKVVVRSVNREADGQFLVVTSCSDVPAGTRESTIRCCRLVLASGIYETPARDRRREILGNTDAWITPTASVKGILNQPYLAPEGSPRSFKELRAIPSDKPGSGSYIILPPLFTPPVEGQNLAVSSSVYSTVERSMPDVAKTVLVIGTGISAAEAVSSLLSQCTVVHIFKWHDIHGSPCSFRRFPKDLYPEYSKVFGLMRKRQGQRYEGLANAQLLRVTHDGVAEIELEDGTQIFRSVQQINICTGRSGSLSFVCPSLGLDITSNQLVDKWTFRGGIESTGSLEVGKDIYVIGSLCGDTIVRFFLGACALVASKLLPRNQRTINAI